MASSLEKVEALRQAFSKLPQPEGRVIRMNSRQEAMLHNVVKGLRP